MNRLLSLVTANWGLKLLSLVLAILIYHTLKPAGKGEIASAGMHLSPSAK